MTYTSLSHVLNASANTSHNNYGQIVSFDENTVFTRNDFLGAVAALKQKLEHRSEKRWLLVHENSYCFAIGLLSLLAADKTVVLPPNAQPGTLVDLAQSADAFLGEGDTLLPCLRIDCRLTAKADLPILDNKRLTITLMTSGSTGQAKSITKPLSCFENEINALEELWGAQLANAVVMSTVSHQHIYGLLFRVLWPLCAGRSFNAITHQYPEPLIADIKKHSRCVLISSPAQLKRFPPGIDLSLVNPHIAQLFSSGGPLPLETAIYWQQHLGQAPVEVLGSTETGGIAWRIQTSDADNTKPAPWNAFNSVEVKIDKEGLLFVHSPFLAPPENNTTTSAYTTGDLALAAPDGKFYLLGRADTVVKIEEKRLSLPAMEQHLQKNTLVSEARVVPLPDEHGRLGAIIVLSEQGISHFNTSISDSKTRRTLADLLRAHLLTHYERILLPRKWRFVDQMPINSQGKTTQADLKILFKTAEQQSSEAPQTKQRVVTLDFEKNRQHFEGHFPDLPILPGVVQIDIAIKQCIAWYPLNTFRGLEKLKFLEPIIPGDIVTLTVTDLNKGSVHFNYAILNNSEQQRSLSSGRILFSV